MDMSKVLFVLYQMFCMNVLPCVEYVTNTYKSIRKEYFEECISKIEVIDVGTLKSTAVYAPSWIWTLWSYFVSYMNIPVPNWMIVPTINEYACPHRELPVFAIITYDVGGKSEKALVRSGDTWRVPQHEQTTCPLRNQHRVLLQAKLVTPDMEIEITDFMNMYASVFSSMNKVSFLELYVLLYFNGLLDRTSLYRTILMSNVNELNMVYNVTFNETVLKNKDHIILLNGK